MIFHNFDHANLQSSYVKSDALSIKYTQPSIKKLRNLLVDTNINSKTEQLFENRKTKIQFVMIVLDFIVIVVAGGLSFLPLLESVIWVP